MREKMYIPETIHVGFQSRQGTFTGKLGYIIYTDEKGKLRKETSWNSWRDTKISPVVVKNTPQDGFTFNKGIQRDGYWGSGRSVIRVYDARDFEFEISVDNLIGILMHADVTKREITEKCVYAWYGKELVLLPVNSVEYQESLKYTAKMNSKFSAKDLVVGHSYSVKNQDKAFVYLGYMDRHETYEGKIYEELHNESLNAYYRLDGQMKPIPFSYKRKQKQHMFIEEDAYLQYNRVRGQIKNLQPTVHVAGVLDEKIHDRYAELYQIYLHDHESSEIKDVTIVKNVINGSGVSYDSLWRNITLRMLWEIDDKTRLGLSIRVGMEGKYIDGKYTYFNYGLRASTDYYYIETSKGVVKARNEYHIGNGSYWSKSHKYVYPNPTNEEIEARFPGILEYFSKLKVDNTSVEEINEQFEYLFVNYGIGDLVTINELGKIIHKY